MLSPDNLTGKRILICEDEGVILMQLDRALRHAGLVVVGTATNGKEGVDLARREKPDIILMDVVMPGMNGLEATRQILEQTPTCIVMLTANTEDEIMEQAALYGAAGFIPKPILSETLLPALQQALQMFYKCHP